MKKYQGILVKKAFSSVIFVQMLCLLCATIAMFIDSIIIGGFYDSTSLAAYGLVNPISLVITLISGIITTGVQVVCGKASATNNRKKLDGIFSTAIILCFSISILFSIICIANADFSASFLGAPTHEKELHRLTKDYLIGYTMGVPFACGTLLFSPFLILKNKKKYISISMITLIILNVVLDLLNVLVFRKGIWGIGFASTIANAASLIIVLIPIISKAKPYKFSFALVKLSYIKELFSYGNIYGVYKICRVITPIFLNRILYSVGGTKAVAVYSVIASVHLIVSCIPSGIGNTSNLLLGCYMGEKDSKSVNALIKIAIQYSVVVNLIVIIVLWIFAPGISYIFTNDSTMAVIGLRFYSLSTIVYSINYVVRRYYNTINKKFLSYTVCVLDNMVMIILSAFVMVQFLGVNGVWLSWIVGESITLVYLCIYIMIKQRKISLSINDFLLLDKSFIKVTDNEFSVEITDKDSIDRIKDTVEKYISSYECDNYETVSEITSGTLDIINKHMTKNKKNKSCIDVRLRNVDSRKWMLQIKFYNNYLKADKLLSYIKDKVEYEISETLKVNNVTLIVK